MALVTGSLKDFSLAPMSDRTPQITFSPSAPAAKDGLLLATPPVSVYPTGSGSFSVDLQPTDELMAVTWYTVRISWLESGGGYVAFDFPDWKLFVPQEGGAIGDLIDAPINPALVYTSLTPPTGKMPLGIWWLESNPDNINDPANTGILHEWSS
jgi:hypothetical protein